MLLQRLALFDLRLTQHLTNLTLRHLVGGRLRRSRSGGYGSSLFSSLFTGMLRRLLLTRFFLGLRHGLIARHTLAGQRQFMLPFTGLLGRVHTACQHHSQQCGGNQRIQRAEPQRERTDQHHHRNQRQRGDDDAAALDRRPTKAAYLSNSFCRRHTRLLRVRLHPNPFHMCLAIAEPCSAVLIHKMQRSRKLVRTMFQHLLHAVGRS